MDGRICTQCLQRKSAEDFSWRDGKARLGSRCHACRRESYKNNPHRARERAKEHYWASPEESRRKQRARRRANLPLHLVNEARRRADAKGVPFDLSPDDISVPKFCPVLGIELKVNKGRCGPGSPTLDRVRPEAGYVRGNVVVVSHRANTIKSDATLDEIEAVAEYMRGELAIPDESIRAVGG